MIYVTDSVISVVFRSQSIPNPTNRPGACSKQQTPTLTANKLPHTPEETKQNKT